MLKQRGRRLHDKRTRLKKVSARLRKRSGCLRRFCLWCLGSLGRIATWPKRWMSICWLKLQVGLSLSCFWCGSGWSTSSGSEETSKISWNKANSPRKTKLRKFSPKSAHKSLKASNSNSKERSKRTTRRKSNDNANLASVPTKREPTRSCIQYTRTSLQRWPNLHGAKSVPPRLTSTSWTSGYRNSMPTWPFIASSQPILSSLPT